MRTVYRKAFVRNANLAWVLGLYCFQICVTGEFSLKLWRGHFGNTRFAAAGAVGLLALALGALLFVVLEKRAGVQRFEQTARSLCTFLYLASLLGVVSAQHMPSFLFWLLLNGAVLGYGAAVVGYSTARAVGFDRCLGLIIGAALLIAFLGLAAACRSASVGTGLLLGFSLTVYLVYRPPVRHYTHTCLYPRKSATPACKYRLSVHCMLAVLFAFELCLLSAFIAEHWRAEHTSSGLSLPLLLCGFGALLGGLLRDQLNAFLPLLTPAAVGVSLAAVPLIRGGGPLAEAGLALSAACQGVCIACLICNGLELPKQCMRTRADAVVCAVSLTVPAVCYPLADLLVRSIDTGVYFAVYVLSGTALILLWFSDYIACARGAEEDVPYDIRLARFCEAHGLSARESEVLAAVLPSTRNLRELAGELYISARTLEKHMANIYTKTSTKNRTELFRLFYASALERAEDATGAVEKSLNAD